MRCRIPERFGIVESSGAGEGDTFRKSREDAWAFDWALGFGVRFIGFLFSGVSVYRAMPVKDDWMAALKSMACDLLAWVWVSGFGAESGWFD